VKGRPGSSLADGIRSAFLLRRVSSLSLSIFRSLSLALSLSLSLYLSLSLSLSIYLPLRSLSAIPHTNRVATARDKPGFLRKFDGKDLKLLKQLRDWISCFVRKIEYSKVRWPSRLLRPQLRLFVGGHLSKMTIFAARVPRAGTFLLPFCMRKRGGEEKEEEVNKTLSENE
jgi:hypothetical protein